MQSSSARWSNMALASQIPPPTMRTRNNNSTALAIRRSRAVSTYLSGPGCSLMRRIITRESACGKELAAVEFRLAGGYATRRRRGGRSPRHRLLHHGDELLERERLGQEIELLVVGQRLVEGVLCVAGHKDDLDVGFALLELFHQRRPVHFRHDHVRHHDVDLPALLFELLERLDAVAGLDHGVAA